MTGQVHPNRDVTVRNTVDAYVHCLVAQIQTTGSLVHHCFPRGAQLLPQLAPTCLLFLYSVCFLFVFVDHTACRNDLERIAGPHVRRRVRPMGTKEKKFERKAADEHRVEVHINSKKLDAAIVILKL